MDTQSKKSMISKDLTEEDVQRIVVEKSFFGMKDTYCTVEMS